MRLFELSDTLILVIAGIPPFLLLFTLLVLSQRFTKIDEVYGMVMGTLLLCFSTFLFLFFIVRKKINDRRTPEMERLI